MTSSKSRRLASAIPAVLVILSLACSLPGISKETPVPASTETAQEGIAAPVEETEIQPTVDLPPALVETNPPPGSSIPLSQPITFYFNQPMDHASVEGALSGQPALSGAFQWEGDDKLTFTPDAPFLPETQVSLTVGTNARSSKGLALVNPLTINYQTTGYLRLTQVLPQPQSLDVDPSAAVVASFNRPVVPLGGDSSSLPPAFSITTSSGETPQGRGEWVNTSTYIFYPEPALAGNTEYTAAIDPGLTGVDGAPLDPQPGGFSFPLIWSFTTAFPEVVSISAGEGTDLAGLDSGVIIDFNQVMDQGSVEDNFDLIDPLGRAVPGEFEWSEDGRQVTFQPDAPLQRGSEYTASLSGEAAALGETPIESDALKRFTTVPELAVTGTTPVEGGFLSPTGQIEVYLTSPLGDEDVLDYLTLSPEVPNLGSYFDPELNLLRLYGTFEGDTAYTLVISSALADKWGGTLGQNFVLNFRTGPIDPNLSLTVPSEVLFLTPTDSVIKAQSVNLSQVPASLGSVLPEDFILMLGPDGYNIRQTYQPADRRTWTIPLSTTPNRMEAVDLTLNPEGTPLSPGLYYLRLDPSPGRIFAGPYLIVVSKIQLTFKLSSTQAVVWAVDLRTGEPVPDAPVRILDEYGQLLAQGNTGEDGVFQADVTPLENYYISRYAVSGNPGEDTFALAASTWTFGLDAHNFDISNDFSKPGQKVYLYSDRPIYRPGQVVFFKAVVRNEFNGRYTLPEAESVSLPLYNDQGLPIFTMDLPLTEYGTGNGEYRIPDDAAPGYYRIGDYPNELVFQVANYRKPEINLSAAFTDDQILLGEPFQAQIEGRYFFDAPASGVPVQWTLYQNRAFFSVSGYQVGDNSAIISSPFEGMVFGGPGLQVDTGSGVLGADGTLSISLDPEIPENGGWRALYTLEVTAADESGLPVSARAEIYANPAPYYIGIRPSLWAGRVGLPLGFEIQTVNWYGSQGGEQRMIAQFRKVTWEREDNVQGSYGWPTFTPVYTRVGSTDFASGEDGRAALSFTANEPGVYELRVEGDRATSTVLIWISGPGEAIWPNLPNQEITLTPDRDSYRAGGTAQVFIPNPTGAPGKALVSVERDIIMRYEVIDIPDTGLMYELPLTPDDAPNVYLSVTLLGQPVDGGENAFRYDFRQGYTQLDVTPEEQELQVELTRTPESAGPGDEVVFSLQVTDSSGEPVQGEFSLAVADLAALALAEPNSIDILSAFYGEQPLGVRTALDLAVHPNRSVLIQPGLGGGGGSEVASVIRENFPDTAYWNAVVVTGEDGRAEVAVTLPDTLTTWQVDVRGVTQSTQVGQATTQVVTTKDLLVRPVTPRFLVVGDKAVLAAVVQNNTRSDLNARVSIQAQGAVLDDPSLATQEVAVPAGGRTRVEWKVTVQDGEQVDLVFSAEAGGLQDAARPPSGSLPVLRYVSPQTYATSGTLDGGDDPAGLEKLELISLPKSYDPAGGELRLELSPSLGAALIRGLEALELSPYDSTEVVLSRFLPNLQTLRALREMGVESPDLQGRLDLALADGLAKLLARQNMDGGWGWWTRSDSDFYLSAYVLYGLSVAREAGIAVDAEAVDQAAAYLTGSLAVDALELDPPELDRRAMVFFALARAGYLQTIDESLYERRGELNPWAQALLALAIQQLSPGDGRVTELIQGLESTALETAAGTSWESKHDSQRSYTSPVTSTAIVLYAIAQLDPASPQVPGAMRYLMAHRETNGGWASTYETAWSIQSVVEAMKGTGEWSSSYAYGAELNGSPFAAGEATGSIDLSPVTAAAALSNLFAESPNSLRIWRDSGPGRLYYTAYLDASQPVDLVGAVDRGIQVERRIYPQSCSPAGEAGDTCNPVVSAGVGQALNVRVTVSVPNDTYNLVVEDYIPAGAEILDTRLETSQLGLEQPIDPENPYREGWGSWFFQDAQLYDDHILWAADFVPAGTYELTYTLVLLQPGTFHVLPAHAWQFYFPEVQGNSPGSVFVIEPQE